MENKTAEKSGSFKWFLIALMGAFLSAPNGMVVRLAVGEISPLEMNALRFLLVALVCLPFIRTEWRKLNREMLVRLLRAGVYLTVAVSAFVTAVKMSQASYAAIILLLTPVMLLIYSVKWYGEKLTRRTMSGISLAAMGAVVLVALPFAQGGGTAFYPMATLLLVLNCVTYPLAIFEFKKINESGISTMTAIGGSAAVVAALSFLMLLFADSPMVMPSAGHWVGIVYSGLAVALLGRMCKVWSVEYIGAAITSAVMYFEVFLGIVLPIIFLHEKMSSATIIGGALVLFGVYVVESHKHPMHRHHHIWRAH